MKKKQVIIGVDVSKSFLDVYIHGYKEYFQVGNNPRGLASLLEKITTLTHCKETDMFFCFENTGKYSKMLSVFLSAQSITFIMEPSLRIKKSLGLTRGKNDKVDCRRIALYAYEKKDHLVPTVLPGSKIDEVKGLLSLREKLIKHRTAYKNALTDLTDCYVDGENDLIKDVQNRLIDGLNSEIHQIENRIKEIIRSDPRMYKNYQLLLSIVGIGKIVAFYLIALTANFTSFAKARSFACYSGIAPFENSSGTIIGKPRVHPYANKQIKAMLNLAAMSAIQKPGEYRIYYNKRVNELKKSKMSTINIIRNKLVSRAFAVVNRGTPYVDLYKFAA
jgi:transposase